MPNSTLIFQNSVGRHSNFYAGTQKFNPSAGRHCVPGPISALFLSFFQQRGTRHGWHAQEAAGGGAKKQPLPPLFDPFTFPFLYKYNHGLHGKEGGKREKLVERSRNLVLKIHLKQNSPLQSFKALEGWEISPFIVFGIKIWKTFALKFS